MLFVTPFDRYTTSHTITRPAISFLHTVLERLRPCNIRDNGWAVDLALTSRGAKVVKSFSHAGRPLHSRSWFSRILRPDDYASMATVLDGDVNHCWEFAGSSGQLAVSLANCANITHIVIDHPATAETAQTLAPYEIVVWGLIDGRENEDKISRRPDIRELLLSRVGHAQPLTERGFLPLAAFKYNGFAAGRQEFPSFPEIAQLEVDFGIVVVQVRRNWGGSSTRMCHVGIQGFIVI